MADGDTNWGCVLPFLNDDPVFAHGVEIGMLHQRMKTEDEISGDFLLVNQDQITLMASRYGWEITSMTVRGDDFSLAMHRV